MAKKAGAVMLTTRIHNPGERVVRQLDDRPKVCVVPPKFLCIACEACEWDLLMPEKMGRDHAEVLRRRHIETVHWTDQLKGRVCINVELAMKL